MKNYFIVDNEAKGTREEVGIIMEDIQAYYLGEDIGDNPVFFTLGLKLAGGSSMLLEGEIAKKVYAQLQQSALSYR